MINDGLFGANDYRANDDFDWVDHEPLFAGKLPCFLDGI
jgi:hypothetical protein